MKRTVMALVATLVACGCGARQPAAVPGPVPAAPAPAVSPARSAVTVKGVVYDSTTGKPLEGAQVVLLGTESNAFTDSQGRFALRDVPQGDYVLRARRVGYAELQVLVSAQSRETTVAVLLRLDAMNTPHIRAKPG